MNIFSHRLKFLRERSGLTQKEIADKLGLTQAGYGKIENGQREPNLAFLSKLPFLFGESLDFLLGVTDYTTEMAHLLRELHGHKVGIKHFQESLENAYSALKEIDPSNKSFEVWLYKKEANESILTFHRESVDEITIKLNKEASQIPEFKQASYDFDNTPIVSVHENMKLDLFDSI